ncbi:MAG TPA: DUF4349 domain-containing protein, partial [Paludibacter sp.]|nr:DUF4349 domain-containing protein [Paludibacter sp.]
ISCAPKATYEAEDVTSMSSADKKEAAQSLQTPNQTDITKKKIIKDGRLGIKVNNLKESKTKVDTIVKNLGGYYDKESLSNNDYSTDYDLKIRVPSNRLEILIDRIEKGEGEVAYKEIDARDVTEEFIDLETRLTNKQKYLLQYQVLLKSAKSIKEILDIQEKIRGLEEEIESTTGRLKYLNDLVNYSTLELNISQKKDFKYTSEFRGNFFEKLKQSIARGWYGFVDFFLFLISNWAILILFSVLIYFWIKYRKKKKSKTQKEKN